MIDFQFDNEEEFENEEKVLTGYIILPCFKAEVRGEETKLVCNDFFSWVFERIFIHFWTGRVHITGVKENNERE